MDSDRKPTFYWERSPGLAPERLLIEEAHLAMDINHGRLLVRYPSGPEHVPDELEPMPLEPDREPEDELLRYSDAVGAILQAAEYVGFDSDEACRRAQFTMRAVRRDAVEDAAWREGL